MSSENRTWTVKNAVLEWYLNVETIIIIIIIII